MFVLIQQYGEHVVNMCVARSLIPWRMLGATGVWYLVLVCWYSQVVTSMETSMFSCSSLVIWSTLFTLQLIWGDLIIYWSTRFLSSCYRWLIDFVQRCWFVFHSHPFNITGSDHSCLRCLRWCIWRIILQPLPSVALTGGQRGERKRGNFPPKDLWYRGNKKSQGWKWGKREKKMRRHKSYGRGFHHRLIIFQEISAGPGRWTGGWGEVIFYIVMVFRCCGGEMRWRWRGEIPAAFSLKIATSTLPLHPGWSFTEIFQVLLK